MKVGILKSSRSRTCRRDSLFRASSAPTFFMLDLIHTGIVSLIFGLRQLIILFYSNPYLSHPVAHHFRKSKVYLLAPVAKDEHHSGQVGEGEVSFVNSNASLCLTSHLRYHINLPAPTTKLAEFRRSLAEFTQLPEHSFKLIHAGATMKDDNAPCKPSINSSIHVLELIRSWHSSPSLVSAYGIRENSVIVIIGGSSEPSPQAPYSSQHSNDAAHQYHSKSTSQHKTEASTINQIQSELDNVRTTLWPSVDTLLFHISPPPQHLMAQQKPSAYSLDQEHKRLSELLLQSLLRLDAITADGGWEEARRERKGAVKEVQGLLDRLDEGWSKRE
jgi:hypothetical protein